MIGNSGREDKYENRPQFSKRTASKRVAGVCIGPAGPVMGFCPDGNGYVDSQSLSMRAGQYTLISYNITQQKLKQTAVD